MATPLRIEWQRPWPFRGKGAYRAFFELWFPGEPRVFCFDEAGNTYESYEHAPLSLVPRPATVAPGRFNVTVQGRVVAVSKSPIERATLSLTMHLPTSESEPERIPHHLGDAVLQAGWGPVALFSHADHMWCDVQVYCWASLGPGGGKGAFDSPIKEEVAPLLREVFERSVGPDLQWMLKYQGDGLLGRMARTNAYQAVAGAPLFSLEELGGSKARFENQGATSGSLWRLERGGPPCEDQWLMDRVLESLNLRGPKPQEVWDEDRRRWLAEYPQARGFPLHAELRGDVRLAQAKAVALLCFSGDAPLKPHGEKRGMEEMHNWARELMEDVVHALGALAVSRRYVYDHRWVWNEDTKKLVYHNVTDEHYLAFIFNGDCEDANTTIYYLYLHVLQCAESSPLAWLRPVLRAGGVPCCVLGSSSNPSTGADTDGHGAHLYGFAIPPRIFARLLWGDKVDDEEVRRAVGVPEWAYRTTCPHVFESICFVGAAYRDRTVWRNDTDLKRFNLFARAARELRENPVLPGAMGAFYSLATVSPDGERHGFIVHMEILRVYTAAVRLCFPASLLAKHARDSLELDLESCVRAPREDLGLERTHCFVALKPESRRAGVPTEELHRASFRLASCTRLSQRTRDADLALFRYARPFIPLKARGPLVDTAPFAAMLEERGVGVTAPLPPSDADRFVGFVFADRLERGREMVLRNHELMRPKGIALRPYCWCIAVVFRF